MKALHPNQAHSGTFTLRVAGAVTMLLLLLFIAVLTYSILRERRDTERRAEDRALAASQVVSTNALWIWELSRQALGRIDEALGADMEANAAATATLISDAVGTLPGNVKAYVVAPDGRTLFSTDPNVKPIDVRDRDYFAALAGGEVFYVSPLLVSRLDGAQIFVFSKRLERDGQFAGAAIISFDVVMLKDVWDSLRLDGLSTVSLVRDDGQLVARYPFAEGPLDLSTYELFTQHLKANERGTYPAISPADGVRRMVGYGRVPGTRFIALASLSNQGVYAAFRRNTFVTLAFALPLALALAGAIAWLLRLLADDQKRRAELMEALDLNRLLVKDTHHRVKNNLQAIMSMVRMHKLPGDLKSDLQNRIAAMSAVHEHLYRLDQFTEVSADTLIPGIVEPLREGFAMPVTVAYALEPVVLDRDQATPLALLVSEVVTNAMKYAFPDGREGKISIALARSPDGEATLTVRDDGVGFDEASVEKGLGSRLIRAMLLQLGGSSSSLNKDGTTFTAHWPLTKPAGATAAKPAGVTQAA